jgi:hypothetical protein
MPKLFGTARWQFSTRQLLWWVTLCALCMGFALLVPKRTILAGPLWLAGTGHYQNSVIGFVLAAILLPLAVSYLAIPSRAARIVSIVAIVLWFALGGIIRTSVDW